MQLQRLRDLEITENTVVEEEKAILKYNDTIVFSSNNMSIINGPKGSMKSTEKDYLIKQLFLPSEGYDSTLQGSVLIIDTEMSKRLIKKSIDRYKMQGIDISKIRIFSLKGQSPSDRIRITERLIENIKPEIVVIDGSRDYVVNSNDPSESMKMINILMYWVYQYNLHIVNIVHSVNTDRGVKTKGTFGSELENKAETILSMERRDKVAKVSCAFSRESLPFKSYKITIDTDNIPVLV